MSPRRYITMSRLGRNGRWGNMLFEYIFLKCYARQYNLEVQIPPWAGNDLLGVSDAPVTATLPRKSERRKGPGYPRQIPPMGDEFVGCDFRGHAQYHTSYYRPYRDYIRQLLNPVPAMCERMAPAVNQFDSLGRTRVAVHLRGGDYGRLVFYLTPLRWYLDWLRENWSTLDEPVLFVASEDRALVDDFRDYNPQTAESLGIDLKTEPLSNCPYMKQDLESGEPHLMDFFPDWYMLTQCEYLLMPNSTFSFTAAMLSDRLQHAFRSDLPTQQFQEIDVWDAPPLAPHLAEDYRYIPGVCLASNPQW